mgnify:CR=1 FL=1
MIRQTVFFCMLASPLFVSLGCNDSSTTERCQVSADCPLPLICYGAMEATSEEPARAGQCIQECRVDSDCADGLCIESVCRTPEGSCRTNADCVAFGRTCDPGTRRCVAPCGPNSSCPQGTQGVNDQCQPVIAHVMPTDHSPHATRALLRTACEPETPRCNRETRDKHLEMQRFLNLIEQFRYRLTWA